MIVDPDAALDFLEFVAARHRAWTARQHGDPQPWTSHIYVNAYKFTNVYRVLDYGSQFVLSDLIDPNADSRDQLMRLFLYRHTGRVEVWQYLDLALGGYPTVSELEDVRAALKEYRGVAKVRTRNVDPRSANRTTQTDFVRSVFTGAYLVFPQSQTPGTDKLDSIVDLTKRLFDPSSPDDIMPSWDAARSQAERFKVLRDNKGVADFMSMQILTDWGYSPQSGQKDRHTEDSFVVAGPGARKGAAALAPGERAEDVVKWAAEAIRSTYPQIALETPSGDSRPPSYMDAQNCLCEFSKLVRYRMKPLPEKVYRPAHPGRQPEPLLPLHW